MDELNLIFELKQLSSKELKYLRLGGEYFYSELFMENNILCRSTGQHRKRKVYVWCEADKLWKQSIKKIGSSLINAAIARTMLFIIYRGLKYNDINESEQQQFYHKFANIRTIRNMRYYIEFKCDSEFSRNLDRHDLYFPILNGRKINLKTREITTRTISDYFTYEFKRNYCHDLKEEDNIFAIFLQSVWIQQSHYQFWRKVHAIFMMDEVDKDYLIVWFQPKIGGGKTIWINSIEACFGRGLIRFDTDMLSRECTEKKSVILSKLKTKKVVYFEGIPRCINLNYLSKCYDIIDQSDSIQKRIPTTVLMGNESVLIPNEYWKTCKKRTIYMKSDIYFRRREDPEYNVGDIKCKESDTGLWDKIENNLDHVFTFFINCMYEYIHNGKPDLDAIQPEEFKKTWRNIRLSSYKIESFLLRIFLKKCRYNTENRIELKHFLFVVNRWIEDCYGTKEIKVISKHVRSLLSLNNNEMKSNIFVQKNDGNHYIHGIDLPIE